MEVTSRFAPMRNISQAFAILFIVLVIGIGCASNKATETDADTRLVGKWRDKAFESHRSEVEFFQDGKGILTMREPSGFTRGEVVRTRFWFTWKLSGDELTVEYSGAEKGGMKLTPPPFEKSSVKWHDDGSFYVAMWDPGGSFQKVR